MRIIAATRFCSQAIMAKKEIFLKLAVILYIIAALNFLADYFHLYYILWWFDILMHFLGGFWVGGMVLWFYFFNIRINKRFSASGRTGKLLLYFAAVLAVSVVWELFEFSLDTFVVSRTNDIMDTLSDLFMDTLGAGSMLAYFFYGKYRNITTKNTKQLI